MKVLCQFILLLNVISITNLANQVYANEKSSTKHKINNKLSYDTAAFDLTNKKLAPNYIGHNMDVLYKKIQKSNIKNIEPTKNKFETSEEFNKRLENFKNRFPLKNFTKDSLFTLSKPAIFHYNADTHEASAMIEFEDFGKTWHERSSQKQQYCSTSYKELKPRTIKSYKSNAFGATIKVEDTYYKSMHLAILKPDFWDYNSYHCSNIEFNLSNITTDEARRIDNNLSILIIFKLNEPFVTFNSGKYMIATIDSPYGSYHSYDYILGQAVEIWLYNNKTGSILAKKTAQKEASNK